MTTHIERVWGLRRLRRIKSAARAQQAGVSQAGSQTWERYPERSLKQITERMVFDHLIHLREEEKLRPSTLNQAVVALRMFYRDYLGRRLAVVGAL